MDGIRYAGIFFPPPMYPGTRYIAKTVSVWGFMYLDVPGRYQTVSHGVLCTCVSFPFVHVSCIMFLFFVSSRETQKVVHSICHLCLAERTILYLGTWSPRHTSTCSPGTQVHVPRSLWITGESRLFLDAEETHLFWSLLEYSLEIG